MANTMRAAVYRRFNINMAALYGRGVIRLLYRSDVEIEVYEIGNEIGIFGFIRDHQDEVIK